MALEENDGDVDRWVRGYIQHLTSTSDGDFKSFTSPGAEDIVEAIDTAEAEIVAWLAEAGYSTDISTYPTLALRYLSWYNGIGASYRLEMFHPGLQFSNAPNTRFDRLHDILMELKQRIDAGEISGLGIPIVADAKMRVRFTAETLSEKDAQEEDTDAVQPFFRRRSFRHPEVGSSIGAPKEPS